MRKLLTVTVAILLSTCGYAQLVQWHDLLYHAKEMKFLEADSARQINTVYNARVFIYDSLKEISTNTGKPFLENVYTAEFKTASVVNHLVIDFKDGTRFMYYIKLFDENGGPHMVYDYSAIKPCEPGSQTLLLTIARTPYKVKKVEIGTFYQDEEVKRVAISGEQDGNKVLQDLVAQRIQSICSKTSFLADRLHLGANINSASNEVKPVISTDGKTLYIHRQNDVNNIGKAKDDQDIYVSYLKDDQWTDAVNVGAPLNDKMPNGIAAVSTGGNTVYLINEYLAPNKQKQGLSVSEKTLSGWSFPKKIEIDNFYNKSPYLDYHISPTQNEMILAIQRDDSYGDQDLYVSFYDDAKKTWTEPANLGEQLNTALAEASPFLAADGKTLYFSSNGYLGYGGFDLFVTHRLDDSWKNWSTPENLGPVINSDEDDLYYTIAAAGDYAYFVSITNGNRDVYRITLPKIYKPEPVVLLAGKIFNSTDLGTTEADVSFSFVGEKDIINTVKSDGVTGEYKTVLPAGGIYSYVVKKEGFQSVSGTISTIGLKKYQEKEQDVLLYSANPAANKAITIHLLPSETEGEWDAQLKRVALISASFPKTKVEVTGSSSDTLAVGRFRSLRDVIRALADKKNPNAASKITERKGKEVDLVVMLPFEGAPKADSTLIPADYKNPVAAEAPETTFLIKGKIIDAATLKPVAAQMVFKVGDKVKSRSSSDPESGRYQAVLASNTAYDLKLYQGEKEHIFKYQAPALKDYQEVEHLWITNQTSAKNIRVEAGSGVSRNMDEKATKKWKKFLKKKKATKELLVLMDSQQPLPLRVKQDLDYLAEIAKNLPETSVTLITHVATGLKDGKALEDNLAKLSGDYLVTLGISNERIKVNKAGDTQPKNKNPKHHTNTRLEAEISLPDF